MKCVVLLAALLGVFATCQSRSLESNNISILVQPQGPQEVTVNVYRQIASNIAEKIANPIWNFLGLSGVAERKSKKCSKNHHKNEAKPTTAVWENITNDSTEETTTVQGSVSFPDEKTQNETEITSNYLPEEWVTTKEKEKVNDNTTKELAWENITNHSNEINADSKLKLKQSNINVARDIEEVLPEKVNKTEKKPEKYVFSSTQSTEAYNDTINEISDDEFLLSFSPEPEKPKESGIVYFLEVVGSIFQLAWGAISSIFKPK